MAPPQLPPTAATGSLMLAAIERQVMQMTDDKITARQRYVSRYGPRDDSDDESADESGGRYQ